MSLMQCAALSKHFGGLKAVDGVDLAVAQGEIVGLIGPNGSGKSTVVNLVSGVVAPTAGRIVFDGTDITGRSSRHIARLGIARTFQLLRLFKSLTVLENVLLALHPKMRAGLFASALGLRSAVADDRAAEAEALALLDLFGLREFAHRPATALSIGQQRMVELARGMIVKPRLFVLDEPAAGLSPPNVEKVIGLIRQLRDEHGITILLVEHVMKVVQELCDRVVVLDYGVKIAEGPPREIARDPRVIEAYIGSGTERAHAEG